MGIRRFLFYLTLILLSPFVIYAQNTPPELAVKRETETDGAAVFRTMNASRRDTNYIKLAIKAAHIYWHQRSKEGRLDSCFMISNTAYQLSAQLRYTEGMNEAGYMLCKIYTEKHDIPRAKKMFETAYGEQRVRLMLAVGEYYVFEFERNSPEFLEAPPLLLQAIKICEEYHSDRWWDECFILQGKYFFKKGEFLAGKESFMKIVNKHHLAKNYEQEAKGWSRLGNNMPENDSTFEDIIHSFEMAVHSYYLADNLKEAAYSLRDLGIANGNHNRVDSSEKQLLRVVSILKSIGEKITPTTYYTIGDFYRFTGQYDKALYYILESLKVTKEDDIVTRTNINFVLGMLYFRIQDYPNSLKHYKMCFESPEFRNNTMKLHVANEIAYVMAASGDHRKGLAFLDDYIKTHPSTSVSDRQENAGTYGQIYAMMGNYAKAEKFYLEMLSLDKAAAEENGREINVSHYRITGSGANFLMGKFYAERGKYSEANQYLNKSLQNPQFLDASQELETYQLLFKTDSALGNYLSAIKNFERHRNMYDSINSVHKSREINDLNLKYQTEQRLKDIEILRNKETKSIAALQRADTIRNLIIAGALVLLLLAVMAYYGYRNKQRSNLILQSQGEEIDRQNKTLQTLLSQKDQFLKEKEWLLKEIHHRVKNNLQIIMSLLNSQSAHLRNSDAIEAIMVSGNRVRSIALIHQKLYSGDNLSSINMPEYVADLLRYMMDGFDTAERKVRFIQRIEGINIDVAQAVPVGLILNEAITNAIKYAFDESGGEITVAFRSHTAADTVVMSISDNGKGLPADFDFRQSGSLGMEMMQGLARQLRGQFNIDSNGGTTISVEFRLFSAVENALSTMKERNL
ncbi:Two-component sensor histidine kinase, contains HisKA and HATPase domains [Chitinophaga sp. YR627]|nr:Two-component sensor histidine kinase, contains HisKA and HATPase domains [Chitinophaga sp. YR627]